MRPPSFTMCWQREDRPWISPNSACSRLSPASAARPVRPPSSTRRGRTSQPGCMPGTRTWAPRSSGGDTGAGGDVAVIDGQHLRIHLPSEESAPRGLASCRCGVVPRPCGRPSWARAKAPDAHRHDASTAPVSTAQRIEHDVSRGDDRVVVGHDDRVCVHGGVDPVADCDAESRRDGEPAPRRDCTRETVARVTAVAEDLRGNGHVDGGHGLQGRGDDVVCGTVLAGDAGKPFPAPVVGPPPGVRR
jgi:hypothetical protein